MGGYFKEKEHFGKENQTQNNAFVHQQIGRCVKESQGLLKNKFIRQLLHDEGQKMLTLRLNASFSPSVRVCGSFLFFIIQIFIDSSKEVQSWVILVWYIALHRYISSYTASLYNTIRF